MKCALLLFGISYCDYEHREGKKTKINYIESYYNYKKYIYKYLYDKGFSIEVYFSTNFSNKKKHNEIIKKYKPVKYSFIRDRNGNAEFLRNKKIINVIELCLNNNVNYDLVLITRFDLLFQTDFKKSNIKLDKFNLVSILEHNQLICDNFYLFPFSKLKQFHEITKKNINKSFHRIKTDIEKIDGKEFVNYILNEYTLVCDLSFYKVVRRYLTPWAWKNRLSLEESISMRKLSQLKAEI